MTTPAAGQLTSTQRIVRLVAARRYASTGQGRQVRERAGLSLQEVADAIGTVISTVSRWETGLRRPRNCDAAIRWAELLGELERGR